METVAIVVLLFHVSPIQLIMHHLINNFNRRSYNATNASNAYIAAAPSGSYDVVVTTANPTTDSLEIVVVVDHIEEDKDGIQPTNRIPMYSELV